MNRPSPQKVFDDPRNHWGFLTQNSDDDFEGQHFERKEAGQTDVDTARLSRQLQNVRSEVRATISAFANSNVEGGLLVLGITSNGTVNGIDHLSEQQRNSLTDFPTLLHHQAAEAKFYQDDDAHRSQNTICLIYVPYIDNGICETPERTPKAWARSGCQNIQLTPERREQIRNDKGLVHYELTPCCQYEADDVAKDVLKEFKRVFWPNTTTESIQERVLYEAGAIVQYRGRVLVYARRFAILCV